MHLQLCRSSTRLARIPISLQCQQPLCLPIWASIAHLSIQPGWAFFASRVPRCLLPDRAASWMTKIVFTPLARDAQQLCTTCHTGNSNSINMLDMRRSPRAVLQAPSTHALSTTKCMGQSTSSVRCAHNKIPTPRTWHLLACRLCFVSASKRTTLLLHMLSWWLKQLSAMGTRLGMMLATRLIRAGS